jgi:hypothetical protein
VAEIDILANDQALGVFVGQNSSAGGLGFADDARRARLVQEAVVDAAGVPGVDTLRAAEGRIADQRVAAAVVVAGVVVGAEVILLNEKSDCLLVNVKRSRERELTLAQYNS